MPFESKILPDIKCLGKVYTPDHIVEKILIDSAVYWASEKSLILDMSCGDGRFLIPIVKNILYNCPKEHREQALSGVHGWDIDADAIAACRANLDKLIAPYGLNIHWNLRSCDALKQSQMHFDYIITNPPYIRLQNLSSGYRKFLIENFLVCKNGSTDIYLAFFEKAQHLLTPEGVCAMITPNSYFSTAAAQLLRNQLAESKALRQITNYGDIRLFGAIGTYSAITIFGKKPHSTLLYETCDAQFRYTKKKVSCQVLSIGKTWTFEPEQRMGSLGKRLGDICKISVGITTLADHIYIVEPIEEAAHLLMVQTRKGQRVALEKSLTKPILKASKLRNSNDPIKEVILFPYKKDEHGRYKIMPEPELKEHYPFAYHYLCHHKEELALRDKGKINPIAWYAFGRAQSLDHAFGRKIVFSPINKEPNFVFHEGDDCTVYSGYFIKTQGDYHALLRLLNSERMLRYIQNTGRHFQGGYKGYNKQILSDFPLN